MPKVTDVISYMENWAPPSLAESWDNVGLLYGNGDRELETIMVTLDISDETMQIAINKQVSMIISHHPPIFKPLTNLSEDTLSCRVIRQAIKNDIALFTSHTNLDKAPCGVSDALAHALKLTSIKPLIPGNNSYVKFVVFTPEDFTDKIIKAVGDAGGGVIGDYSMCSYSSHGIGTYIPGESANPFEGIRGELSRVNEDRLEMIVPAYCVQSVIERARDIHPYEEMAYDIIPLATGNKSSGYGAIGKLTEKLGTDRFLAHVATSLAIDTVHVSTGKSGVISTVAVSGGSGASFINAAIAQKADAFVSGEFGHHNFIGQGNSLFLVDASHRATELPIVDRIAEKLSSSGIVENCSIIVEKEIKADKYVKFGT